MMEFMAKAWVHRAEVLRVLGNECARGMSLGEMEGVAGRYCTGVFGSVEASPIHQWKHLLMRYDSIVWPSWLRPSLALANRTILRSRFIPQSYIPNVVGCKSQLSRWLWINL